MKNYLLLFLLPFSLLAKDYQIFPGFVKPSLIKPLQGEQKLVLSAAKGEFVGFVIRLNNIKSFALKGLEAPKIDVGKSLVEYNVFWMGSHNIKESSYGTKAIGEVEDILIPLNDIITYKIQVPKENQPKELTLLFELYIPPNAKSGRYDLELSYKYLKNDYSLKFPLDIYRPSIPRRLSFETSFGFAPWTATLKHYGEWVKDNDEMFTKYFDLATNHRIDMHKIYSHHPKERELKEKGLDYKMDRSQKTFWNWWETLYNGTESQYGFKWNTTDLPAEESKKSGEDSKYWKQLNDFVKKSKMKESLFVYYHDEPPAKELKSILKKLATVKKSAPDLNFLIAAENHNKSFYGLVDWLAANYSTWSSDVLSEKKKDPKLKKLYFYTSCNSHGCAKALDKGEPDFVTDRLPGHIRSIPWIGFFQNFDGFLYYDTLRGYLESDLSPWKDPFLFTGYGEGNLFYPCNMKICKTKKMLVYPSLRLKILRDGLEDFELLKQAQDKKISLEKYKDIFSSKTAFWKNDNSYEKAKRELMNLIGAKK